MGRYSIELVGESNYQDAVRRLAAGDFVDLVHEPENRFDRRAVKAIDARGVTVGYVPRDSWLTGAIIDQGVDVVARVRVIVGGERGKPTRGVVLDLWTAREAEAVRAGKVVPEAPHPQGFVRPGGGQRAPAPRKPLGCGAAIAICFTALVGAFMLQSAIDDRLHPPAAARMEGSSAVEVVPGLSADAIKQCRDFLEKGRASGVIKARPSPNRLNVDDALWLKLDARTKDMLLQAVSCDLWGMAMPSDENHVVAYGHRSGKRLQMLTSAGVGRD